MKVALIATETQKAEILAHTVDNTVELVWMDMPAETGNAVACFDLLYDNSPGRKEALQQLNAPILIVSSVIATLKEIGPGVIRINGWPTFLQRPTWEVAGEKGTDRQQVEELFRAFGRNTEWVPDVPGFISLRVIASIINEAFWALGEEVSTEQEIDTAMKLGTNYPFGPFEWGQKIGLHNVYTLLEGLGNKQNRYKPAPLLKERTLV